MRSKAIKLISAVMAVIVLASCTNGSQSVNTNDKLNFQHESQGREVGLTESIIQYKDNYAFGVNYPVIGISAVDTQIKAVADGLVRDFEKKVQTYKAATVNDRAVLSADYKAYLASESKEAVTGEVTTAAIAKVYSYASIVFEIAEDIPGNGVHKETVKTCLYNLKTGKLLSLDDILHGDYLNMVSKTMAAYFTGNRLFSADSNTALFKKNTLPKAENYQSFAVVGQTIVFYFDMSRILPEKYNCPSAAIPISSLKSFLKINLTGIPATPPTESEKLKAQHINHPKVDGKAKLIALTFDDGPRPAVTNRILDALKKCGGRATFFVVGTRVSGYSKTIKRAYSLGCEIGNHSYSHSMLTKIKDKQAFNFQIAQTNKLVYKFIPEKPVLFRIPYANYNDGLLKKINMPIAGWNIDPDDWKYNDVDGVYRSPAQRKKDLQKIINNVLKNAKDGDVVIMHDIYSISADACDVIIPALVKKGFTLVTMSEMLAARGKQLKNGEIYSCARP